MNRLHGAKSNKSLSLQLVSVTKSSSVKSGIPTKSTNKFSFIFMQEKYVGRKKVL